MSRNNGVPVLLEAVFSRDLNRVRAEIAGGAEIDARDRDGRTSLFQAIVDGSDDIAGLLIERGLDVNARDKEGETALHFAARENRLSVAELLVKAGAEVDAMDAYGNTPLARAVFASRGRCELIRLLIANGADRERKNLHGISPLDLAKGIGNYNILQFLK